MALLVCGRCGAPISTMREALIHCPVAEPEQHVSHERAAADPSEYCSRLDLDEWAETGRSRPRP